MIYLKYDDNHAILLELPNGDQYQLQVLSPGRIELLALGFEINQEAVRNSRMIVIQREGS